MDTQIHSYTSFFFFIILTSINTSENFITHYWKIIKVTKAKPSPNTSLNRSAVRNSTLSRSRDFTDSSSEDDQKASSEDSFISDDDLDHLQSSRNTKTKNARQVQMMEESDSIFFVYLYFEKYKKDLKNLEI